MRLRRIVMLLAVLMLFSAPSWAGSFGAYGSYWDSKDADSSWGAGVRVGFDLTKRLELGIHATYFPDFKDDSNAGQNADLTAIPVDAGLRFNFQPDEHFNPYLGGGVSYYFLSISPGQIDDKTGVYLVGGFDMGDNDGARFFAELMWRKVDTSVKFGAFDEDVRFDGININAGASWRWGQ